MHSNPMSASAERSPIQLPTDQPNLLTCVDRELVYDKLPLQIASLHKLQIDSDIVNSNNRHEYLARNKKYFFTPDNFRVQDDSSPNESKETPPPINLKYLNNFLYSMGKMPDFLEVKDSPGKGLGVFTKTRIEPELFIGYYEGIIKPNPPLNPNTKYLCNLTNYNGKVIGSIDGENLFFSNFARFINDGNETNILYIHYGYQVFVYTKRQIEVGEELLVSYSDTYWKQHSEVRKD